MAESLNPRPAPLRFALLPRGIDGLFLPPTGRVEPFALVERDSADAAWAESLFGRARIIPYRLSRIDLGPYPTTGDLLTHSDAHSAMAAAGVKAFLLTSALTPITEGWARRHRIRLIASNAAHQRRLEDKIRFHALLARHAIPAPAGGSLTLRRPIRLPVNGPAVLQIPDSLGGEGTFFVEGPHGVEALIAGGAVALGDRCLVRERVDGRPLGITVLVTPGQVALSALRLQCYYPSERGGSLSFAGIQWLAADAISPRLHRRVNRHLLALGEVLHGMRFFGFANVDFMVDARDEIFLIECNPRMSAATAQLMHRHELLSGVNSGEAFLRGFRGPRRYPRRAALLGLPDTTYRGATLDIGHHSREAGRIVRDHPSGLYSINAGNAGNAGNVHYRGGDVRAMRTADHFCLFSFARAGQTAQSGDTLATVVSNAPLYDRAGGLSPRARHLLAHFRYLGDRE